FLAAQPPARADLTCGEGCDCRGELHRVLALSDEADEEKPGQSNHFGDGLLLSVGTLEVAEDDVTVPFDARQDQQEVGVQLTDGRAVGLAHENDLQEGSRPRCRDGSVWGNRTALAQHRADVTRRTSKEAPAS